MAKKNKSVPQYGTVTRKGILYYRTRIQDADGKWYYFNIGTYMVANADTPDGYHVDENGVWDGKARRSFSAGSIRRLLNIVRNGC